MLLEQYDEKGYFENPQNTMPPLMLILAVDKTAAAYTRVLITLNAALPPTRYEILIRTYSYELCLEKIRSLFLEKTEKMV